MAGKTRSPTVAQAQGAGPDAEAPALARQPRGNEAAKDKVPDAQDAGLASYESALGELLGGELYRAVQGALGFDALKGQAHSAVAAALSALGQQVSGADGVTAEPAAMEALVGLLQAQLDPMVDAWLAGDGRALQTSLAGWAGAHPRTVASIAMLAACGAVLANLEIPALKKRLALSSGTDLEIEAEVGRLRAIALKKLKATLTHTSGPLVAAIELTHGDTGTAGTASLKHAEEGKTIEAKGTFDGEGLVVAGLSGEVATSAGTKVKGNVEQKRGQDGVIASLGVAKEDGDLTLTNDYTWSAGVLTVGASALRKMEKSEVSAAGSMGSDGSHSAKAGAKRATDFGEVSGAAESKAGAYGLSAEQKLSLGVKYEREGLKAALDAALTRTDGVTAGTVSGTVDRDLGDGTRYGGSLNLGVGSEPFIEAGAYYGFSDPAAFRSWLLEYKHTSKTDDHQLKVALEQTLGPVLVRAQSAMSWGGSGRALDLSVHAAHFQDADTAWIAGGTYKRGESGSSFTPEVGFQHKKVQVLFGYDQEKKGATIRMGVPF
jgi:hypothetical protein